MTGVTIVPGVPGVPVWVCRNVGVCGSVRCVRGVCACVCVCVCVGVYVTVCERLCDGVCGRGCAAVVVAVTVFEWMLSSLSLHGGVK